VDSVRVGKYLEVQVQEEELAQAEEQVSRMCSRLLANPVIEDFRYELEQAG
jgi:phosphoribosylformylglycinamidine synthase